MSDDIFSRLFELFDQPGPINWKLAAEVARNLAGERVPIDPWAAEEYRELARLAEYRIEEISPFRVTPVSDVVPVDGRAWVDANLDRYGHVVEPFGDSVVADMPGLPIMGQLRPSLIGLQVGSLVGALSLWVVAGFDAGIPPDRAGPLAVLVPNVAGLATTEQTDDRELRLWVVANEVAFQTVCALPWIHDHLAGLTEAYAATVEFDPTKLNTILAGGNPAAIEAAIEEAGGIDKLIGGEGMEEARREVEAFLGAVTGCARLLARRATAPLSPGFDSISQHRDRVREAGSDASAGLFGVGPVPPTATRLGDEFNQEVERRYGDDALVTLWSDPSRMPSAAELADPTAWAARVLLDGWE